MNIAISGANGFIGKNLTLALSKNENFNLVYISRIKSNKNSNEYSFDNFFKGEINIKFDFFIHLASPNYDYCKDNSIKEGIENLTKNILLSLNQYDCKNFIFFSSCKVYGESSLSKTFFNELSSIEPISDYANSKAKTENLVKEISLNEEINYLIYRMPFVYGPGMRSNISILFKLIDKSIPIITFGNKNGLKKSFLSTENINRLISYNLKNTSSIDNEIYNISDTEPVSLDFFLKEYKKVSNSKTIIMSFPKSISNIFFKIPILNKTLIKIFGDFQIDNKKIYKKNHKIFLSSSESIRALFVGKIDKYE